MRYTIFIIWIIIFAWKGNLVLGQSADPDTRNVIIKSQYLINKRAYSKAEKYLRKSINKVRDKEAIWIELGKLAMFTRNYSSAAEYYKMALYAQPGNKEKFTLPLVDALIKTNDWINAEYYLADFDLQPGWTEEKKNEYRRLKQLISSKDLIIKNRSYSTLVENAGPALNDPYNAYLPFLYKNDSLITFTVKKGLEEDLYYAYRDTCNEIWDTPVNLGYPPNTALNENSYFVSIDEKYRMFTRCNNSSDNGRAEGGCDLIFSYHTDNGWQPSNPFGTSVNTPSYEGMPSMDPSNKTIYFVSNRPGGYGGMDIWKTEFKNNFWSAPVNLGPNVNTGGDEIAPFIAPDGKTLYFSSDAHKGLGGQDIFFVKQEGSSWSKPENLGAPYNSQFNEFGISVSKNSNKAYFSSDRPGGYGGYDIYLCFLLDRYMYEPQIYFSGYVIDSIKHETVKNAVIEIYDEDSVLYHSINANAGDGSYFFILPYNKDYTAHAARWDYPSKTYSLDHAESPINSLVHLNFELLYWEDKKKQDERIAQMQAEAEQMRQEIINNSHPAYEMDPATGKIKVRVNYRLKVELDINEILNEDFDRQNVEVYDDDEDVGNQE